jgi:hypothetical protein
MAWEGERTVTFTMEDALISPEGFMILSGAGLVEGKEGKPIQVHVMETSDKAYYVEDTLYVVVDQKISEDKNATLYAMIKNGDEIVSEPYIGTIVDAWPQGFTGYDAEDEDAPTEGKLFKLADIEKVGAVYNPNEGSYTIDKDGKELIKDGVTVMVDYYTPKTGASQIEITPDKFGGNYYLEASTLFRNTDGVDMPAEFIIPNCKIQSNFSFNMASSGDPSTFTFTMDAFPDYTRFDSTKKVLAAIQIITETQTGDDGKGMYRTQTWHNTADDKKFN